MNVYSFKSKILFLFSLVTLIACQSNTKGSREDSILYSKIDSLIKKMSYSEKMGQLSQIVYSEPSAKLKQDIRNGKVGSLLIIPTDFPDVSTLNELQRIAVEESKTGIPIIYGHDVIHGFKTIFPLSLAQSCTWDTALVKEAASIAAKEASAYGMHWTFAPMVDVSRDPRWGRIAECFGEDTYLNECFGAASVKGYQGENVSNTEKIVACLKHYVGYGAAMGGRDYQYTDISERTMQEVYLPPFKSGVDAGALTVMSAFNDINGIPATANPKYLKSTLKKRWGFSGFVVSDWDAVEQLIYHGYAADSIDAAIKSIKAGIDMEMKSHIYPRVPPDKINKEVLDEAVRRVLYVKFKKGLFDTPYTDELRQKNELLTSGSRTLARKVAAQSMVLLENNNILPISENVKVISVIGPFAKEQQLMGWWKSMGNETDVISPITGLKINAPKGVKIIDKIDASTDIIIICVGEKHNTFGENNCRPEIRLPDKQSELIEKLEKYGKPIVTVVFNGRPLDLTPEKENSDALLLAWHPGTEAGNALADVLFGKVNPSGKLTASFPGAIGQIPIYYNHRNSGRPASNNYKGELAEALYPFGYGLSYAKFKYKEIRISADRIKANESVEISAKITNTGRVAGTEIVQLYVRDLVGTTTRPVKELKGFKRISLNPGETKEVLFTLKAENLAVLNTDLLPKVESGEFKVWVAPNSKDGIETNFSIY